ncbi:MAG: hypothetical protein ABL958_16165 [Bdellovibrionia bacterium]
MKRCFTICLLVLLGCSQPSETSHTGTQTGGQPPQETWEWPNDPVTFYANNPPVIDFATFQPQALNVTPTYNSFYSPNDDLELTADLQQLKNYKVIFLQGIMGNYVDFMGKLIMNKFNEYEYYYDYFDWLESVGVEYELLKTDTEDPALDNSILLEEALEKSTKPVVIVAHSKGGVETMLALTARPSLHAKVKGVLFLQSPFYGTPVADYLQDHGVWDFLANFVLMVLGGSSEGMHNLSTYERVPWMAQWDFMVKYVMSRVKTLCFSTWKDDEPARRDSIFEFSRNKVKENGVDNDGLVPWNSMILPEGRYVQFEGHDHASPVTDQKYIAFDRARFFKAMLRTLYSN